MGKHIDLDRNLKLQEYILLKRDFGEKIDIEEAARFTGYSAIYLKSLFHPIRIISKQIHARIFHEGSRRSEEWYENFEERINSLRFWCMHLRENHPIRIEVEQFINEEEQRIGKRLRPEGEQGNEI